MLSRPHLMLPDIGHPNNGMISAGHMMGYPWYIETAIIVFIAVLMLPRTDLFPPLSEILQRLVT
ncbi:hypothetical protein SDC9_157374 [bioreactor metagenome]|uniref:Uncharacterized protein n=1 Tax=bioreactor metagenome TaxID=1076179 RepID=A0A645F725_9ZZZZ